MFYICCCCQTGSHLSPLLPSSLSWKALMRSKWLRVRHVNVKRAVARTGGHQSPNPATSSQQCRMSSGLALQARHRPSVLQHEVRRRGWEGKQHKTTHALVQESSIGPCQGKFLVAQVQWQCQAISPGVSCVCVHFSQRRCTRCQSYRASDETGSVSLYLPASREPVPRAHGERRWAILCTASKGASPVL